MRDNAAMTADHDARQYPLYLYEFRYRDLRTGGWRKARHRAELHLISERYAEFELDGEPMVIHGPSTGTFNPFRQPQTGGNE